MKSTVSERGQVTIPKKLRDRLGLRPGQVLEFDTERGALVARKRLGKDDPVTAVTGILPNLDVDKAMERSRGPKWTKALDEDGG